MEMKDCIKIAREAYEGELSGLSAPVENSLESITSMACSIYIQDKKDGVEPSQKQLDFLVDLCGSVGISVPKVNANQISPVIDVLKDVREKGQGSVGRQADGRPAKPQGKKVDVVCEICGNKKISKAVVEYSKKNFDGRIICFDCQKSEAK